MMKNEMTSLINKMTPKSVVQNRSQFTVESTPKQTFASKNGSVDYNGIFSSENKSRANQKNTPG